MKKLFSILLSIFLLPVALFANGCGCSPEDPEDPENPEESVYELSSDGKYVYFGEYPQTIKANDVTITSETPDEKGYYLGSDGERYYKQVVDFSSIYPPEMWDEYECSTLSNGYVFSQGDELYFRVDKLKWRILSKSDNLYFLVCDTVVQHCMYQPYYAYYSGNYYVKDTNNEWLYEKDGYTKIYANNYKYSELRRFLTNDFYNRAFSQTEKSIIPLTEVDNSAKTTDNVDNAFVCENTNDYVFALSYQDIIKTEYGFSNNTNSRDIKKGFMVTDFGRATGVIPCTEKQNPQFMDFIGTGGYYLRSPSSNSGGVFQSSVGIVGMDDISIAAFGVLPALCINI